MAGGGAFFCQYIIAVYSPAEAGGARIFAARLLLYSGFYRGRGADFRDFLHKMVKIS